MAEAYDALLDLSTFKGFDSRAAGPNADPQTASSMSNADTNRLTGALCTARGRQALVEFLNLGQGNSLARCALYVVSPSRLFVIGQDAAGTTLYWDSLGSFGSLSGITTPFTQAVQSNGILWLNNGQQIFLGPDNALHVALWNYPAPSGVAFSYAVSTAADSTNLAAATYSYAFVQQISIPNIDGTVLQYTTATGATAIGTASDGSSIYPYQVVQDGTSANTVSGIFAGVTADGYDYVTQVFRFSSASPNWFLWQTLTTNGTFYDTTPDASISGNEQLIAGTNQNQDPPSTGGAWGLNPICASQDRLWTLAVVNDASTNNFPQTQVLYSRPGEPWSFDLINQALLVDDQDTILQAGTPGAVPFGNQPSGISNIGSSIMLFQRAVTSMVYGVDQATYQVLSLFTDLGCVAPLSVIGFGGIRAWIAALGPYIFDGSNLTWIGEQVYNLIESFGPAAVSQAVGFGADQSLFWSFPTENVTLWYYMPNKSWKILPYATSSAVFLSSMPSDLTGSPVKFNMVLAARPGTQWVDFWAAGDTDLGQPISATFTSQETHNGHPEVEKTFKAVAINAPLQPGVTAQVEVYIDGVLVDTFPDIDLGTGPWTTTILNLSNDKGTRGYLAHVVITLNNVPNATGPAIIYAVKLGGTAPRAWSMKQ